MSFIIKEVPLHFQMFMKQSNYGDRDLRGDLQF